MTAIDEVLKRASGDPEMSGLGPEPRLRLAILTCMDARIDTGRVFGIKPGEAHVLRNAGGIVTPDVVRSLILSQRTLGTREIMVVHHSPCGVRGLDAAALAAAIEEETGRRLVFELGGFRDAEEDVRLSVAYLRELRELPHRDRIRGFVLDTATGTLREVE
jgi:carbonic anhydrase